MRKLRIGFISTAGIGRKNWKAIFHSGNSVVAAVAGRNAQRSADFVGTCQRDFPFEKVPVALGCYEALIESKDVDAVYLPLPTGLRKEWAVRAAEAGKHVLCEKPCAANAAELQEIIAACRRCGVQFMDGVMFMHSPRLARVREKLDDGVSIGPLRRISSSFSFYFGEDFLRDNIRVDGRLEPAGCLGDLGWYCLRFALWAMKWQMPGRVSAALLSQSAGGADRQSAPTAFSAELVFKEGVSAGFYCSFLAAQQQWVHVSGQHGCLQLPDFVHPFNSYAPAFKVNGKIVRVADEGVRCPAGADPMIQGHPTAQDTRMFRHFADQIFSGRLNEDWPQWSLKTQQVMDACLRSAQEGGQPVKTA